MAPAQSKRLEARLAAFRVFQAIQIGHLGEQLPSSQELRISFVPFDKLISTPGSSPEFDITGTWRSDTGLGIGGGAYWTFRPRGDGTYEAEEDGFGDGRGIARVNGAS